MDDSKKITRNLSFIKKSINEIDNVIDVLIEEGILGMAERNIILSEEDPIHSVLETVLKKQAYSKFTKALQSTGNDHIVDRLETKCFNDDQEKTEVQTEKRDFFITENTYEKERKFLLKKDLECLIQENDKLKEQQAQIRKDLNDKQQKLLELNREACTYQKQNLELSQRLSANKKSDIINEIIDDLEKKLKSKDQKGQEVMKDLEIRNNEISCLRIQLDELKKAVDEKTEQIDMLTREMKYLREEHTSARGERKELKSKIESLNSNLEGKMKSMMSMITDNRTMRTPRQSSFSRMSNHTRNASRESYPMGRENSSVFPVLNGKKTTAHKDNDTKTSASPKESPRTRFPRPQQFISPQFVFKNETSNQHIIPKWK